MTDGFTPFAYDSDDDDDTGFWGRKNKVSKEEQIYGIFGGGYNEDKYSKSKEPKISLDTSGRGLFNFIKSNKPLIDSNQLTKGIRVDLGKRAKKDKIEEEKPKPEKKEKKETSKKRVSFADDLEQDLMEEKQPDDFISSEDEAYKKESIEEEEGDNAEKDEIQEAINKEILRRKRAYDFKQKKPEMSDFNLPTSFERQKKKVNKQAEVITSKEALEAAKMEEQYGKGWKMMQNLGYKLGTGLGKNEQGRLNPLQAHKKTFLDANVATSFDFVNADRPKAKEADDDLMKDLLEERGSDEETYQRASKPWKKGRAKMKAMRKERHLHASDLSVNEGDIIKPISEQKVIDMRGPQVLFFEGYSGIKSDEQPKAAPTTSVTRSKFLGDMLLTIKGNFDKAKYNIQNLERKMKIEKDKIVNYNYEKQKLMEDQEEVTKKIQSLKKLQEKLVYFKEKGKAFTARESLGLFHECFQSVPEQFFDSQLDKLFISDITKKLQAEEQNWHISEDTLDYNYELFLQIKEFLIDILTRREEMKFTAYVEKSHDHMFSKVASTYDQQELERYLYEIFNQSWALPVRTYVLNFWNPKDCEPLISLFEKWEGLVPQDILNQIYDSVMMPKLKQAVESWSPTTDRVMIHIWLHPWLPLLGMERLSSLWKPIQLKFSQALVQWHPKDKSALMILKPWFKVFDYTSWENLMMRCILPKLLYSFKDFTINPKKQQIEPVEWLLDWAEFLPEEQLTEIVENYILKKLEETAKDWASTPGVNKKEMEQWIKGWKHLIGEKAAKLLFKTQVSRYFERIESLIA